jgi:outer membrane receptor protein involved in Fe transport
MRPFARALSCLAFACYLTLPVRVSAQAVYGSIAGVVVDPTGAAVAGAKVTVRDIDRDISFSTVTNETGNYTQQHLIAGRYQVKVEAQGFRTFIQETLTVSADTQARLDVKVQVGEVNQSVEVSSEAALLKTDRSDVAIQFDQKAVNELPMLNRRFSNLQLITPGVMQTSGGPNSTESENPMGSYRLQVNGQMYSAVSHLLDGTDNHDSVLAYQVINPTLESVTEAKITTSAFDAEIGNAGAMVVSAQTKSGTNQVHGSLFEFVRNNHLQARDPFTQSQPIFGSNGKTIPVTIWNQAGGSIGGPIKKNKLFYFGDYQATRRRTGGSKTIWVPSPANRAGDLSDLGLNIFDPDSGATTAARTQFAGNLIPTDRLSSQAQALMKFLPLPNRPAAPNQPNYQGSGSIALQEDSFNIRIDDYATDKLHIFGRYSLQRFDMLSPAIFGIGGGPGFDASNFAGTSYSLNHSVAAGFDYAMRPTLMTDFRFGFYRYYVNVNPLGLDTTPAKDAGIPGLNVGTSFTGGMPQITGLGSTNFGFGLGSNNCNCPLLENQKQFQFVNNWTKNSGNHTIKFGVDVRKAYNLRVPSDSHRSGQLSFASATTQGPNGGGSGFASYLLGDVSSFARYVSNVNDASERQNRIFAFVQDSWHVSQKLTLNYGLRWEWYRPQYVNGPGKGGAIDLSTGENLVAGSPGVSLSMNTSSPPKAFAPRIGAAYRVSDKTVVRVGYGRGFTLGIFGAVFGHNVTQNLPVLAIQNVNPAFNFQTVFTLTQGPPAVADPAAILAAQPKGPNGRPLQPNGFTTDITPQTLRIPTIDTWNVTIQQKLSATTSLEVGYLGDKGTHVQAGYNYGYNNNEATLVGYTAGLSTNQRRPYFGQFGWTQNTRYSGNDSSNSYHALQTKLEKRLSQGLQVMGHYTWSKAMDFDSTQFIYNRKLGYGPSNNNRNHTIVAMGLWEVPVGRGRKFLKSISKPVDYAIGGWQLNFVHTWMSGIPFTPSYQNCGSDEDTGWCRADVAGSWQVSDPSQFGWFATTTAVLSANGQISGPWQRPQRGQFGNVGRNSLRGPHFWQTDFSAFKDIPLREKMKIQLRAEAFNFFNHTNLGQPNASVDSPGVAGRIFATAQNYIPRTWQGAIRFQF